MISFYNSIKYEITDFRNTLSNAEYAFMGPIIIIYTINKILFIKRNIFPPWKTSFYLFESYL